MDEITRKRRYRRRRRTRKPINWDKLMMGVSMFLLISVAIMICIMIKFDVDNARLVASQIKYYDGQIATYESKISEIQVNESTLTNSLYHAVEKVCKNSDDKVIKKLWESEFSDNAVVLANKSKAIVSMYAILNNHPEIRYDVTVAQALYDIDCNKNRLETTVDMYNLLVDDYTFWEKEYNDSWICTTFWGTLKKEHLKMVFQ